MKHEPIKYNGKWYEVFCGCNDTWRGIRQQECLCDLFETKNECNDCGYNLWIYPDLPMDPQPEGKTEITTAELVQITPTGLIRLLSYMEDDDEIKIGNGPWFKKCNGKFEDLECSECHQMTGGPA